MGIALFGGAFDPFHNGHAAIIQNLETLAFLDKILLIPTHIPPHKPTPIFSPAQRLAMVEKVSQELGCKLTLQVSDIELKKASPSWTIDTLKELKQTIRNTQFYVVMGSDNYFSFHTWRYPKEILSLAKVIVINRNLSIDESYQTYLKTFFWGDKDSFIFTNMNAVPISSQLIRDKLRDNEDISGLVPVSIQGMI